MLTILLRVASAQQSDFSFINFSSKDGLSSNTVNAIVKDRYGYMWFATDDGINKFDGVNFTIYRHNPADSTIGSRIYSTARERKFVHPFPKLCYIPLSCKEFILHRCYCSPTIKLFQYADW
ncbi:MAG TPA: two-component regulator propeller domain-containing protein [Chitinophagaceae bacterium]